MKLLASPASPYARKVRVVLAEKHIDCEIHMVDVQPVDNPVVAHNPLGKLPTLLLDDGTAIYDSRVIVEFLDHVSPIGRLIPEENRERIAVHRWEALADGVLDAGALLRAESLRPRQEQSEAWMARQRGKIERGLAQMAHDLGDHAWCHHDRYSLADIALGCCLGWLEFRRPGDVEWRGKFAPLARHLDKLSQRPAFANTVPR
ncbi:MAG: glutathione S-transferase N-terminal domain-containing protein [Betaproteobacteria bacterium]|nr:glutathione S-transferase N-terminal domain-containing protein [Betaproteobacteria bacterium]